MPAETVVRPVKVLTPESVTVPLVVLLRAMPAPARIALTEPLCISKVPVLVSADVPVPVILPPLAMVTVPTVSVRLAPRSRIAVAPSTVSAPVLRALFTP